MTWTTPDFESLPKTAHPDLRLVGSCVMDSEQYYTDRWEVNEDGAWRASIAGMTEYDTLRRRRREERKANWVARNAGLDEYSVQMAALVEEHFGDGE